MLLKMLTCDALTREVCHCIARCPNTVNPVFTTKGAHNIPDTLRTHLQSLIDMVPLEEVSYDAVLLGYGLCGNATVGLTANKFPLVIPRAHDCTTLFLGSKEAFRCHFGDNLSQPWTTVSYAERGDSMLYTESETRKILGMGQSYEELVEKYGEDNAAFLWESMQPTHSSDEIIWIDVPETRTPSIVERIQQCAAEEQKRLMEVPGNLQLIEQLMAGDWPEDQFLIVQPGQKICGVYDHDLVLTSEPVDQ